MKDVFQECLLLLEKYDDKKYHNRYRFSSIRIFSDWSGRLVDPKEELLCTFNSPEDLLVWLKKECEV